MSLIQSGLLDNAGILHGFGTTEMEDVELPCPIFTLRQVHGNRVVVIAGQTNRAPGTMDPDPVSNHGVGVEPSIRTVPEQPDRFTEGDALISTMPGTFVGVRTADCLPVLLADPQSGTMAAIHCGWRGLALGIAGETVRIIASLSGNPPPEFLAALGPAIGPCCYEVGREVMEALAPLPGSQSAFLKRGERLFMDLAASTRAQLLAAGIPGEGMEVLGNCTSCDERNFFSFRARKDAGRMISFIGTRPIATLPPPGALPVSRRRRR